ncbi:phage tail tape measure protein [Rhodococcoides fascians]|uniref:phage tail tape measure protein n=1 Tax=Rhodococcoides fascians TaxID=1828 RepID=UPI0009B7F543|nr:MULTISPECIES: phage tail tape measure protein [Rhodococcus]OZF00558.1 phage tail tape measure protein [Rhodococcus sp. 15-1189-1-1a]OZF14437.1 phage tail tape measure protein [Rhodococcus sp. 14-2686-1-2]
MPGSFLMAGGRIDIEVNADTSGVAGQLQRGLGGAVGVAGNFGKLMGAGILAGGVVAAFGEVVKAGNDFTNELNTMQAVSSATAQQMAAVSERAKALGNDNDLSATSASDAAAAMTELAKGGFTVEQSMEAARGTLQLAAAAQIDAATAATIQSQALQAFGLDASYAATASDVLANAANASSAEITDIAAGLQQSGAVANQFGLSIEDTASTLGVLANAGIAGSDAGTLLKSALLAVTDQGKPAQAAIEELGLTIYDANGQFVGMSSLFGQLDEAAANMTPELYQAATATLFGSDAMRLAGVAAEQGQAGYDAMHTAIERQGAAAEVAAAKTQGLPGAMAAVENATETLTLGLYDLIKGPLEGFANGAAGFITTATPNIISGLSGMASAAAPVASTFGSVVGAVSELPTPILAATAALVALRVTGLGASLTTAATGATTAMRGFAGQMAVQRALAAGAGAQIGTFGAAMATVQARTGGAAGALRGMSAALGGPLVIGLVAAGAAAYSIVEGFRTAAEQQDLLAASATGAAIAQRDVAKAFQESQGAMSDTVLGAVSAQVDQFVTEQDKIAETTAGFGRMVALGFQDIGGIFTGDGFSGQRVLDEQNRVAEGAENMKAALDRTGLSTEELAGKLTGSQVQFDTFAAVLRNNGEGGAEAADRLAEMRTQILESQETAKNTTTGFFDLSTAIGILGDEASSADDRVNALKTALDVLSGKEIPLSDAVQAYNDTIREMGAVQPAAVDPNAGIGSALVGQNGAVDTQLANGSKLRDSLTEIRDRTIEVTNATITASLAQGKSLPEAQEAARAAIASNDTALLNLGNSYRLTKTEIDAMAAAEGLLPEQIIMLASLSGSDDVTQQLAVISTMLQGVGQPVDIPVELLDDAALKEIQELGGTVERDINGKPGIVRISAPNQEALDRIREIDLNVRALSDKRVTVTVDYKEVGRLAGQFGSFSPEAMRAAGFNPTADYIAQYGKAEGGPITGGVPGKDSVPILAMPGEHMLTTDDVNRLGGQEGVYRFREALAQGKVRGFAAGGAIVDSLTSYVGRHFPALQMTSGYRDGDPGYHGQGMAADFSNGYGNTSEQLGLAVRMADTFGSQLKELIYDDPRFGREIKNGATVGGGFYDGAGDHTNHVHIATDHVLTDTASTAPILSERDQIAQAIIDEGRRRGITDNGILAALMTGLAESDLQNLPYGDRDSTGVFQQRDNGAWGTAEDRMDPTRAAGMFYDKLAGFDYETMDPADAAQAVQQSAFSDGSNYRAETEEARAILAAAATRAGAALSTTESDWEEKDQIALDRAVVAVTQAEEARDKVYADEKKSQADRDQADLKVKAAKQKVVDLQAEKDSAAIGVKDGPAPQAPDLARTYTDVEIERMEAQMAVDDANVRRNEVYADPEATANDKTKADIALDQARKKLAEVVKNPGSTITAGSGTAAGGFSVKERLKDFGAQVTGIIIDSLFEQMPFGIGDSRWWDLQIPTFGQATESGKMSEGQISGTQPAPDWVSSITTGVMTAQQQWDTTTRKDWQSQFADFINSQRKNAVLRDNGGRLEHGMMALNLSGQDEWVTTGAQRDAQMREIAALRANNAAAVGGGALDLSGFQGKIDELIGAARQPAVTFQTDSVNQGIRAWRSEMNVRSLSFKKRR